MTTTPTPRPVESPEDRMRHATQPGPYDNAIAAAAALEANGAPLGTEPGYGGDHERHSTRSFRTYLDRTERDQLDARAATAEQERDDALEDLRQARGEIDALRDVLADRDRHHTELHTRINALENDLRSANRAVLEYAAENARLRQQLADAQKLIAVVDDLAEQLDRARARYDARPAQADDDERTEPHEDPARLRQQLAEAHADCARYATERDEARAALADPLQAVAERLRLLAEDHATDSLGFGIEWAADRLDAWAKTPDEPPAADLGSPAGRAQVSPECSNSSPQVHATCDGCTGCLLPACRCFNANRAQGDDLADRLAAALARVIQNPNTANIAHATDLLAEHAGHSVTTAQADR